MTPETVTGRCNCGAIRYRAHGPLRPALACHCRSCRRQSGHFYAATAVKRSALEVEGEENLRWYEATSEARRGFCITCGSWLFWEPEGADTISLSMGSLDEPTGIALEAHVYVSEIGDYYSLDDGLPAHRTR